MDHKYGDDILIIYFENTGRKILTSSWYDRENSDPYAERIRVVKAAAEIIRTNVRKCTKQINLHHMMTSRNIKFCDPRVFETIVGYNNS